MTSAEERRQLDSQNDRVTGRLGSREETGGTRPGSGASSDELVSTRIWG